MKELTIKEQEVIKKHLQAFNVNFQPIEIFKSNKNYFIFQGKNENSDNWIYNTDNINHLNGWLYGAVQANNKRIKPL